MHSRTKAVVTVVQLVLAVSVAAVQVQAVRAQLTVKVVVASLLNAVKVVVKAADVLSTVKVAVVHVVKRAQPPLHVVVMYNDLAS